MSTDMCRCNQQDGESPVKCGGKVLLIDGGFSKAYQKVTGIAGYTLIYNSYGLLLSSMSLSCPRRRRCRKKMISSPAGWRCAGHSAGAWWGIPINGEALKERIRELRELLKAYRDGLIIEKK